MLNFVNYLYFLILFYTFAVMEGNVSDISEALSVLTEELRMLRASNDAQYAEICRLTRLVESLNAEIRKRDKKIEELQYLNELDGEQQWSRNLEKFLQEAIHERNENPQAVIDKKPFRQGGGCIS